MRRTHFLHTLVGTLAIALLTVSLFAILLLGFVREASRGQVTARLEATARAAGAAASVVSANGLQASVDAAADATGARLTVIGPDGVVLADSEQDPAAMENHRQRPEVAAAMGGRMASSVRYSSTLERNLVYVAVPAAGGAVVRASAPEESIEELAAPARRRIAIFAVVALAAGFVVALLFSRGLARPIVLLTDVVQRMAEGHLEGRLHLPGRGEVQTLAESLNALAERLHQQFEALAAGGRELDALFSSVQAGIATVGVDGRIVRSNPAFARLSGVTEAAGRMLLELIREPELLEAVRRCRERGLPSVQEVSRAGRVLLASASPMGPGLVLVLQDITDARRLEDAKRELVANVSHELRTPLTAIQGFLEMLEEQAEGEAGRAVQVIGRNVRRMRAIVEDLLVLSRLESLGAVERTEPVDLAGVAADVLRLYEPRARSKGLTLRAAVAPELRRPLADRSLVEQLLVNLVDNAVRYTEQGTVAIGAADEGGEIALWVEDTGVGISEEHLGRVFERFYVVDSARSRELGGTGLGLAIVKHIAQLHGGRVDVASRVGHGSRFTVRLPLPKN